MGIAAAIAAVATLLTTILVWIKGGISRSPTQTVNTDKQAIDEAIQKEKETGRPS